MGLKGILAKSLIVSLAIGAMATLLTSILTASVLTENFISGSSHVVTGIEAFLIMLEKYGLGGYVVTLIPWFIISAITIFTGSVTTAIWIRGNA